jgi:hypothetical protein
MAGERTATELAAQVVDTRRQIIGAFMAVKGYLDTPYPDDPRWTPWTRFVERALTRVDDLPDVARELCQRAEQAERERTKARNSELALWDRHRRELTLRVAAERGFETQSERRRYWKARAEAAERERDRMREALAESWTVYERATFDTHDLEWSRQAAERARAALADVSQPGKDRAEGGFINQPTRREMGVDAPDFGPTLGDTPS